MKSALLFILSFLAVAGYSQEPVIEGDTMLCPNGLGTAEVTNDVTYDSYQWFYRLSFPEEVPFEPIEGATGPSLTYDAMTYTMSEIKVQVTLGTAVFESNTLFIDQYSFLPIFTISDYGDNVTVNPENGSLILCEGTTFTLELGMPYTDNIQWYLDGEPISGANDPIYEVSLPGEYTAYAAPGVCPDSGSLTLPTLVSINQNCELSLPVHQDSVLQFYPNPVADVLHFSGSEVLTQLTFYDVLGKKVFEQQVNGLSGFVSLDQLANGMYIVKAEGISGSSTHRIAKR